MELKDRLKQAMRDPRVSGTALAAACKVSAPSVSDWLSGKTKSIEASNLLAAAKFLNVSPEWLANGVGQMRRNNISTNTSSALHTGDTYPAGGVLFVQDAPADYNITPALTTKPVPVISWVQAGGFNDAADPYPVGTSDEWIECPAKHGPRTFAVKVRGLSMYNPAGKPSFSEGDIIFCDPDRQPENKSLVICRLDDQPEATFKRLLIEDGIKMLEALNPSWPQRIITINGNATICGVVFGRYDSF